jgi:hypothetical protein
VFWRTVLTHPRYDIKWLGHCKFEGSDKVWGWFFYIDPTDLNRKSPKHAYAFWARTGKTPSFKKHSYSSWNLDKLVRQKVDRKYTATEVDKILRIWPTLYEDLDNSFIFHLLADDI